jgi:hypothetical protein
MAQAGRKSWTEELQMAQRYSDLSEPAFKVLRKMLDSDDKADQKWAVEQLGKAFVKMIPQDFTSGGKELPTPIISIDAICRNNSTTQDSETE